MKATYEQAKRDYEYLQSVCPGGDMQEIDAQVFALMANPTKALAKAMYVEAMCCWYRAIGKSFAGVPETVWQDPEVLRIADRYGFE